MGEGITAVTKRPLDRHKLVMADREKVAMAAHEALFPMQDMPPHIAVLGAAVLFAVLCSRCVLDPQELHAMAHKILRVEPGYKQANDSLQSLRDFAGIRLMGLETTVS